MDSASCFGRLLDWENGGYCSIAPIEEGHASYRSYVDGTMVLSTLFSSPTGEARMFDCLVLGEDGEPGPRCHLLRVVEGVRGEVDFQLDLRIRFDYREVKPWLRHHGQGLYSAIGGSNGLLIASDVDLERGRHDLTGRFLVRSQDRVRLSIEFVNPARLASAPPEPKPPKDLDAMLEETIRWWQGWSQQVSLEGTYRAGVVRSAIVLKALSNSLSGAIVAAATTSLPETPGGNRNWDYRYSWIRDASFSVHSLSDIGCFREADAFRHFIERSAAGSAEELQIMYGVGGERRLTGIELPLEG
mgnify:CR=1 FL=1